MRNFDGAMLIISEIGKEDVPPCVICGAIHKRKDAGVKWVYHESKGVCCLSHTGVKEWYDKLLEEANKEFIRLRSG